VNLADVASADPMRLVLTGTVSSTIDGSLIDAFGRDLASARYADGPYVLLPPGARVVDSDATRHRYVVEIPRTGWMPIAFTIAPLASARLVPMDEAKESLTGAIEVAVVDPPLPLPLAAVQEKIGPPWRLVAGGAGLALMFGVWITVRRRANRPEAVL